MTMRPSVRLRAMEPEDLDRLYRIENDPDLWGVGTTNVPYSRYALHDYIATSSADIYTDRQVRLMIEDEDTQMVVGICDLTSFDPRHQRAEVGIVIERPYRCKGYAEVALEHLHNYAKGTLHLHQLYCIVAADNNSAVRLFEKSGYKTSHRLAEWLAEGNGFTDAVLMQRLF